MQVSDGESDLLTHSRGLPPEPMTRPRSLAVTEEKEDAVEDAVADAEEKNCGRSEWMALGKWLYCSLLLSLMMSGVYWTVTSWTNQTSQQLYRNRAQVHRNTCYANELNEPPCNESSTMQVTIALVPAVGTLNSTLTLYQGGEARCTSSFSPSPSPSDALACVVNNSAAPNQLTLETSDANNDGLQWSTIPVIPLEDMTDGKGKQVATTEDIVVLDLGFAGDRLHLVSPYPVHEGLAMHFHNFYYMQSSSLTDMFGHIAGAYPLPFTLIPLVNWKAAKHGHPKTLPILAPGFDNMFQCVTLCNSIMVVTIVLVCSGAIMCHYPKNKAVTWRSTQMRTLFLHILPLLLLRRSLTG